MKHENVNYKHKAGSEKKKNFGQKSVTFLLKGTKNMTGVTVRRFVPLRYLERRSTMSVAPVCVHGEKTWGVLSKACFFLSSVVSFGRQSRTVLHLGSCGAGHHRNIVTVRPRCILLSFFLFVFQL